MRNIGIPLVIVFLLAARAGRSQQVPLTTAQAEAEGAAFPIADPASATQAWFSRAPFAGTAERRCVSRSAPDPHASGSLRSGEFMVRGSWNDPVGLHAGGAHKLLWVPLHGAALLGTPLVLRAARVGFAADSFRMSVAGLARSRQDYGYPSSVRFPTAGQWLVVATAATEWGCFLLDVSEAPAKAR